MGLIRRPGEMLGPCRARFRLRDGKVLYDGHTKGMFCVGDPVSLHIRGKQQMFRTMRIDRPGIVLDGSRATYATVWVEPVRKQTQAHRYIDHLMHGARLRGRWE